MISILNIYQFAAKSPGYVIESLDLISILISWVLKDKFLEALQ
jgi:hypothetical protein